MHVSSQFVDAVVIIIAAVLSSQFDYNDHGQYYHHRHHYKKSYYHKTYIIHNHPPEILDQISNTPLFHILDACIFIFVVRIIGINEIHFMKCTVKAVSCCLHFLE